MEDQQYWMDLIKNTGYTLHGWNKQLTASLHTPDNKIIQLDHELVKFIRKLLEIENIIDDNDYGQYIDSKHGR